MNHLVLGGNGFIGSHLVDHLLEGGEVVRIYDHSAGRFRPPPAGVQLFRGELADETRLSDALQDSDVVYHLVGSGTPAASNQDPAGDVRSHLVTAIGLLDACVSSRVRRVVFLSSGGTIYGPPRALPIPEDHPTNPTCSYGITRLAIEKYLALYGHLHGLDYVVLRGSNAYGERQAADRGQGAVAAFLERLLRHEPIVIWGDGSAVRDYVYAGDLARALAAAGTAEVGDRRTFNVGSGIGVSLNQLVSAIEEVTGRRLEVRHTPSRSLDVAASVLDVSAIQRALHWSPSTALKDGIKSTWRWMMSLQVSPGRPPPEA